MQFITSNVGHCTSVTLLKPWSSVSNFWPTKYDGWKAHQLSSARQSQPFREPRSIHGYTPFPQSCYPFGTGLNMPLCPVIIMFPSSSAFFKLSHSVYKSDQFLHGMSLDRKMGNQKGQGMNLFMILLLALSYSDTRKNSKSLIVISIRIGGIHNRNTVRSDRPNLILQPFSLFPSALRSLFFCLFADPLY